MAEQVTPTAKRIPWIERIVPTRAWMRHFFMQGASWADMDVADVQRRAVWIGLALLLQSLNEIDHDYYIPYLMPFGSLIPFALIGGSFIAIWMALRPKKLVSVKVTERPTPRPWQRVVLILTLLLTLGGVAELGYGTVLCFLPARFPNDGASLDTNAAILLLQGRNPYTDSNILDVVRRFHIDPTWTTPLRQGVFAGRLDYPTTDEFTRVLNADLQKNAAPEFESRVSYPALAFLTLVPFALIHFYNVLPFYLLCYVLLVVIAWRMVQPRLRPWILVLALANVPMWSSAVGGNLDVLYALLIVLAWLQRDRRWLSALFLGMALATKQLAWYFVPFYIIMVWRSYGFRDVVTRTLLAGGIALVINLPFILWNPHAWLAGVLAPIADPMFPLGVGLVGLSVTHLLPFFPSGVYTILEAGAMLLSLLWYWRICRQYPEAVMLLAVLPLFFSWRSLPSYFYCVAFPVFVLMAARAVPTRQGSIEAESEAEAAQAFSQSAFYPPGLPGRGIEGTLKTIDTLAISIVL